MSKSFDAQLDAKIEAVRTKHRAEQQAAQDKIAAAEQSRKELEERAPAILSLIETTLRRQAERRPETLEYLPQVAEPGMRTHVLRCKLLSRERTLVMKVHYLHGLVEWSIAGKSGAQNKQEDLLAVDDAFLQSLILQLVD